MRVLIATPEIAELAPVGGIAEYVLGLAAALLKKGHDVRVVLPLYEFLTRRPHLQAVKERVVIRMGLGATEVTPVCRLEIESPDGGRPSLPVILLGGHKHFATVRDGRDIYNWPNHEPWVVFSRGVVDWLKDDRDWQPDVIHCQDSHTALIPVYIRQLRSADPFTSRVGTVLTIHNLLNQGAGPRELVTLAGLPAECFDQLFEYHGFSNCFKAGLLTADVVNTVSRTYAQEICRSSDFGFGLEGVLRMLRDTGKLAGIVNGIDESRWVMKNLSYSGSDTAEDVLQGKNAAREPLFGKWDWQVSGDPVIAFRARWDIQKGVDLLLKALPAITSIARTVIVTWGTPGATPYLQKLWEELGAMATERPDRLLVNPEGLSRGEETSAHYAVADFFLMPSRYEPCGLTQQECQRFGTIPIVRQTGGLADTVAEQYTSDFPSPNGYVFRALDSEAMLEAVQRAVEGFLNPAKHCALIVKALLQRNGWGGRSAEYEGLYDRATGPSSLIRKLAW